MPTLARVRVTLSGTTVIGGGVATFFSSNSDPSAFNTALRAFFLTVGAFQPIGTVYGFEGGGDTIDETTGVINGSWSMTAPAAVNVGVNAAYAGGVGTRVVWATSGITNGRRVKGSTYIVPLLTSQYDVNGAIADASLGTMVTAANTLRAADSGSMRVYTRPLYSGTGPGRTRVRDGKSQSVLAATVPDKVSWLRSRRT